MDTRDYYSKELQEFAAENLRFDFENGEIFWARGGKGRPGVGSPAGCIDKINGYWRVGVNGRGYMGHRLLYCFYHKTSLTGLHIDHIDGNRLNNRLDNLRAVTISENNRNRKLSRNNTTGFIGISEERGRYRVQIYDNHGKQHHRRFKSLDDALAYQQEKLIEFNYHPNHGRNTNENTTNT